MKIKPLFWVYILSVLLTLHVAVPVFVNSTFLSLFLHEDVLGLIYSAGSILTILSLVAASYSLEKFGNYRTTMLLIAIQIMALLGLILWKEPMFLIFAFLIHFILSTVIGFNADIFLEKYSKDASTGATRGLAYSLMSISWVIAPLLAGFLIGDTENYWLVYVTSILFLIPAVLVLKNALHGFKDSRYHHLSFYKDILDVVKTKDKRYIFLSGLMLKLFFAWMVIYTPIYLHQHIGFNFKEIGFIFAIMTFAYVIFEWPIGQLADKKLGEKELLATGFIVIAMATGYLSFITEANLLLWAFILFLTRTGAAMVEVTTESYFFKKIDSSDTDDIGFWRMLRPVAYLIAPLLVSPFLLIFDFQYIFLAIGIIMLLGTVFALQIKDTK